MGNCLCLQAEVTAPAPPAPVLPAPPAPALPVAAPAPAPSQDVSPLALATYENTPEYTLAGLRAPIKILRIVDGDTVDIALSHPESHRIYRHRVRLWGIDTPEKRPSRSDPNRHLEIEASYRAKEALERRCRENDDLFIALFYHPDKYGRLLCTLYDKAGEDINQWMIAEGHATEYFGKTKKKFQAPAPSPLVL